MQKFTTNDGIQLAYYTKAGHGNHTHVQVNDCNYTFDGGATYRDVRIPEALRIE